MKKIILLFSMIAIVFSSHSQRNDLKSNLYKIEDGVIKGNIESLKEMAKFLDDTTFVQEFLGYHLYPNTARGIAIRIVEENCLFDDDELKIDSTISSESFLKVLNSGRVEFDDLSGRFLITQIGRRKTVYQLKNLSTFDLERIDTTVVRSPYPDWYYENQIDGLLLNKDPQALMWIASAWYRNRSRFNRYDSDNEEFLDLMKSLTHLDLGVPDGNGKTTFLYKDDYYATARLNYLIYWVNHYADYRWNNEKNFFENIKDEAEDKLREEILFGLLNSEEDSIAIDAYMQLIQLDTSVVKSLAKEYEANDIDNNHRLPTFLYKFLRQAVLLTQYCRDNQIIYKAEGWLEDSLNKLKQELNYRSRYRLENYIIENLNLETVTAIEYYGLIHGQEWDLTYSIGRVLDKFYSRKWKSLCSDKKSLLLYLKKAKLFDDLGIIGICNKYRRKFENSSEATINNLKAILNSTNDRDIKEQINKILGTYRQVPSLKLKGERVGRENNRQYGVKNLEVKFQSIRFSKKEDDDKKREMQELFGKIGYQQIGLSMKILMGDTLLETYDKFHFLESDFGFSVNIQDSIELVKFLNLYSSMAEKEVYEYYLKTTGINCFDNSGNLYFPGIYEVLKYDVVDAFVGGGGGRREDGVYLIIKLLELKFKTTLGFPKKLCSWQGIYACHSDDRAKAWMKFLEERGLVKPDKTDPPSISYNN
ncbi:hypothetical protein [Terrimonas alba]|uniref:hypothetical protein n=1 Tax=Terrimonas alba TaxID=3349636 RepID=UPI0035F3FE8F